MTRHGGQKCQNLIIDPLEKPATRGTTWSKINKRPGSPIRDLRVNKEGAEWVSRKFRTND